MNPQEYIDHHLNCLVEDAQFAIEQYDGVANGYESDEWEALLENFFRARWALEYWRDSDKCWRPLL